MIGYQSREALAVDIPWVYDSWLRSFRRSDFAGPLPADLYWQPFRQLIGRILAQPNTRVLVAFLPHDDNPSFNALGWLCFARPPGEIATVHYGYTKRGDLDVDRGARGKGVQRFLLEAAGVVAELEQRKPIRLTFATASILKHCRDRRYNIRHEPDFVREENRNAIPG